MLLTSSDLRVMRTTRPQHRKLRIPAHTGRVITAVLALVALSTIGMAATRAVGKISDDIRYGWPRTTHINGFVGHQETRGTATHVMAVNMQRQIVVIEFPGGDASRPTVLVGPYIFGASSDLQPVEMALRDVDSDGTRDLMVGIDNEWITYLNKDGKFRLPTDDEQRRMTQQVQGERYTDGAR